MTDIKTILRVADRLEAWAEAAHAAAMRSRDQDYTERQQNIRNSYNGLAAMLREAVES